MDVALSFVAVAIGIGLLATAADQFVVGAARIAAIRGVPELVVGIVIVGFGTSAPELLVSVLAALDDQPAVAVGNIVGSNVVNLTFILGVGALLTPIVVASSTVRREAPLAGAGALLFLVLVQNGLTRPEGAILAVAMVLALTWVLRSHHEAPGGIEIPDPIGPEATDVFDTDEPEVPDEHRMGRELLRTLVGLAGTLAGAQLLLTGALDLADTAGLEGGFVGATIVAVGTSLPELVTVVQSARRNAADLVVGNLLGSNLFNSLAVGGAAGLVAPASLDDPSLTTVMATAAVGVSILVWIFLRTGHRLSRAEAAVLVVAYVGIVAVTGA